LFELEYKKLNSSVNTRRGRDRCPIPVVGPEGRADQGVNTNEVPIMPGKEFEEAKLLYELFTKSRQPVKKTTLGKLTSLLALSTGTQDLMARLDRLMKGLPVEDEFAALAVWMGRCKLIHKLEQEQFPKSSNDKYQVPDLLAVFDYNGKDISVLIDVKTSDQDPPPSAKLRLSARLYKKLTSYSKLVGLPLLIAWKVLGHWTLFDIRSMQRHVSAYHIDWSDAWKADLMYLLLGNIMIAPKPGVSFTLTYKDLGPTGGIVKNGEEHKIQFHSLRLSDVNNNQITKMNWPQMLIFMFSDQEELQERRGDLLDMTFRVVEEPSLIPGYALLPLMLFGLRPKTKHPKNWYEVIKSGDFGNVPFEHYKKAAEDGMGVFVQYVFNMVPHKHPEFLPKRMPR
jgi:hypothetical protein